MRVGLAGVVSWANAKFASSKSSSEQSVLGVEWSSMCLLYFGVSAGVSACGIGAYCSELCAWMKSLFLNEQMTAMRLKVGAKRS